jgi:hypothetical protein
MSIRLTKTAYEILEANGWLSTYNDLDTRTFAEDFLKEYKQKPKKQNKKTGKETKTKEKKQFRLASKKLFLTYPQLIKSPERLLKEKVLEQFMLDLKIKFKEGEFIQIQNNLNEFKKKIEDNSEKYFLDEWKDNLNKLKDGLDEKQLEEWKNNIKKLEEALGKLFLEEWGDNFLKLKENLKEKVLKQLQNKLKHIEYYLIGEEIHQDGGIHLHCFLQLKTTFQTIEPNYFDLLIGDNFRHGKYEAGKRKNELIVYIIKDNDFITNMLLPTKDGKLMKPTTYLMSICKEDGINAAKDVLYESFPDLASSRGSTVVRNLEGFSNHLFQKNLENTKLDEVYEIKDFNKIDPKVFEEIIDFIKTGFKDGFTITLVLYGPPQTGKSSLARAIFNYMNINFLEISDLEDFKQLDLSIHQGLLVDDLDWTDPRINRGVRLAIVDAKDGKTVPVKFGAVMTGKKIPRIVTLNKLEDLVKYNYSNREVFYPEVQKRIKEIYIPYELSSCLNERGKVYIQNVNVNNFYFGETFGISEEKGEELVSGLENYLEIQKKNFYEKGEKVLEISENKHLAPWEDPKFKNNYKFE